MGRKVVSIATSLSHTDSAVADLSSGINYIFCVIIRASHIFDSFYWRYQSYYLGTWCYTQYYTTENAARTWHSFHYLSPIRHTVLQRIGH
ncbi:hypothetical protein KIN20_026776 [Parelaphostrongylus tenuis]|uniref:Uncharacterized protein n=1 Tax=Parelaphostrongylus tenuis TaxID=148309 RepID=A0AAD5QYF4_PARTN|nr:hypothetical protein KIN20_026776 [Parelaphostrongylus tenuis]